MASTAFVKKLIDKRKIKASFQVKGQKAIPSNQFRKELEELVTNYPGKVSVRLVVEKKAGAKSKSKSKASR